MCLEQCFLHHARMSLESSVSNRTRCCSKILLSVSASQEGQAAFRKGHCYKPAPSQRWFQYFLLITVCLVLFCLWPVSDGPSDQSVPDPSEPEDVKAHIFHIIATHSEKFKENKKSVIVISYPVYSS